VNLAIDRSGNLMVVSYAGKGVVYTQSKTGGVTLLSSQASAPRPEQVFFLPVSDWRLNRESLSKPGAQFISPDGSTILPMGSDFLNGAMSWGVKSSPPIRSFGLAPARAGEKIYVSDEASLTTWSATVGTDGSLGQFELFAEQGSEGTAVDAQGNVYLAAGEVCVYSPQGKLMETLAVPERPLQLVFGGEHRDTLFIPARTSLYAIRTASAGR
jgi:hypothetical protein